MANEEGTQGQPGDGGQAAPHPSGFNLEKLSPEQQKLLDIGFAKGAEKKEVEAKALKDQLMQTQKSLEDFKANASLSEQAKESLQKQIEQIKAMSQTKEQTLSEKLQELSGKYTSETTSLREKADLWQGLHHDQLVRQALTQAAVEANAYQPDQVVRLLYESAEIVEDVDEATKKLLGYHVELRLPVEENGKAVVKTFTTVEGVKTYLGQNPNLIKSQVSPGGGAGAQGLKGIRTPQGILTQADIENPDNYDTPEKIQKMITAVQRGEYLQ